MPQDSFIGQLMMNSLEKRNCGTWHISAHDVEEPFAAMVGDNIASKIAGAKLVEEKYPHVLWNGCCSNCGDLLYGDICSV